MRALFAYVTLPLSFSGCLFFDHDGTGGTGGADSASALSASNSGTGANGGNATGAANTGGNTGGATTTNTGGTGGAGGVMEPPCENYANVEGLCLMARVPEMAGDHFLAGHMAVSSSAIYFVARHPTVSAHDPANTDVVCDRLEIHRIPFDHQPGTLIAPIKQYASVNDPFPVAATPNRHVVLGVRPDESHVLVGFQGDPEYRDLETNSVHPSAPHANAFTFMAGKTFVAVAAAPVLAIFDGSRAIRIPSGALEQTWKSNWIDFSVGAAKRKMAIGVYSRQDNGGGSLCAFDAPIDADLTIPNADCTNLDERGIAYSSSLEALFTRTLAVVGTGRVDRFSRTLFPQSTHTSVAGNGPIAFVRDRLWVAEASPRGEFTSRERLTCLDDNLAPCNPDRSIEIDQLRRISAIATVPSGLVDVVYFLADIQDNGTSPSRLGLFRYRPR